jgi:hypothetical protein
MREADKPSHPRDILADESVVIMDKDSQNTNRCLRLEGRRGESKAEYGLFKEEKSTRVPCADVSKQMGLIDSDGKEVEIIQ